MPWTWSWNPYGAGPTYAVLRDPLQRHRDQVGHKTPAGEQALSTSVCAHCGAEHDPVASPCRDSTLVGQTLRAGLRVRERLGDTSLGELYRAEYPSGVEVAVLLLSTAASDTVALAALQERLSQAIKIHHPNVAAIYDLNETPDGLIYVVAECLGGDLLSERLTRRGALPSAEVLDVFLQAAAGLRAAHEAGCIHGNLSPETILLSSTVGGPLVKLMGFTQGSPTGATGEANASSDYASPERLAGRKADERSDVYSLGVVLHHLVTGVPPARASEGAPVPDPIRSVLDHALAPSPDNRYQTVAEFVAAITQAEPEFVAAMAPSAEPEAVAVTTPPAEPESVAEIAPPTESESAAGIAPPAEQVVHLIPEPTRTPRRNLVRLGAAAAVLVTLLAGLWLLWRTHRFTLDAFIWPRAEESGAVSASPGRPDSVTSARPDVSAPRPAPSAPSAPRPAASTASDSSLVDLRSVDSTIQVDLRYATANNFTGAPLPGYEAQRALLRPEVAAALGRVQARLRGKGLGLKVFDAYRPVRATLAMVNWAESTGHRDLLQSGYIAERSRHNLGVAVDLTLVDLVTGTEVPMGTTFDNFTTSAQMANADGEALRNRQILAQAMASEGFSPYGQAWWHFNYPLEGAVPLDRVIR
jgi:D-alanyl-D-alanine dipeptidase